MITPWQALGRATVAVCCISSTAMAGELVTVPFDSEHWAMQGGRLVDHLGRMALAGGATLGEVSFRDGVVEVDLAVTGATSYPGIDFRIRGDGGAESIYLRPHRISRYGDGVQYAPKFGGASCWQLYNGYGLTAGVDVPAGEWVTLRLEVRGDRARVYLGDTETPLLEIPDLRRDGAPGAIGVRGPADGSAHFSNFRYSLEPLPDFGLLPWLDGPPGVITAWQVSEPLDAEAVAAKDLPPDSVLDGMSWKTVEPERSGLVNISKHVPRTGPMPDAVLVRTTITADAPMVRPLDIGYSDHATVFLNGRPLFTGRSAYRERDPSFLGVIGYHDTINLPLAKGDNQLVVKVSEVFGGWGVMARWGDAVHTLDAEQFWSSPPDFKVPESVAWDSARRVLYVANYDGYNPRRGEPLQSISKVSVDGSTVDLEWVAGLNNPLGLTVDGDTLWASEAGGLTKIDITTASVVARYPAPLPGMPNDTAVDGAGSVFLSDPRGGRIYRLDGDQLATWLEDDRVQQPNGLHVVDGELMVACNGDQTVKAVNLESGNIRTVARLGAGIIDGIAADARGNIVASHWEGRVFRISPDGSVTKLVDTTVVEQQSADIAYVPELDLLAVPTFFDNRVTLYRVEPGSLE